MTIAKEAIDLVVAFEGCHRKIANDQYAPYLCPARVWTCGIGTTVWPNGNRVKPTDAPITRARAEECLAFDLTKRYEPAVIRNAKVPLHPLSHGSLVSFTYNVGTGAFAKSTLLRMINQRRWSEVPRAFAMYRMGGGRVLAGLERRRKAEAVMFMAGVKAMQSGDRGAVAPPVPVAGPSVVAAPAQGGFFHRLMSVMFGGSR